MNCNFCSNKFKVNMGCSNSSHSKETRKLKDEKKKSKKNKPPKDYAIDPVLQIFLTNGATGDPSKPKDMVIMKESVPGALKAAGITCRGSGDGYEEFCIMDPEFRNCVRFKDFSKFIKAHKKGKAYGERPYSSLSSFSSSDANDVIAVDNWKKIDPQRKCQLTKEEALAAFATIHSIDQ